MTSYFPRNAHEHNDFIMRYMDIPVLESGVALVLASSGLDENGKETKGKYRKRKYIEKDDGDKEGEKRMSIAMIEYKKDRWFVASQVARILNPALEDMTDEQAIEWVKSIININDSIEKNRKRHERLRPRHITTTAFYPPPSVMKSFVDNNVVKQEGHYMPCSMNSSRYNMVVLITIQSYIELSVMSCEEEKRASFCLAMCLSRMLLKNGFNRRLIGEAEKKEIAASQEWKCKWCGNILSSRFEVDHAVPYHMGGSNQPQNLQALCASCHSRKTTLETISPFRSLSKSDSTKITTESYACEYDHRDESETSATETIFHGSKDSFSYLEQFRFKGYDNKINDGKYSSIKSRFFTKETACRNGFDKMDRVESFLKRKNKQQKYSTPPSKECPSQVIEIRDDDERIGGDSDGVKRIKDQKFMVKHAKKQISKNSKDKQKRGYRCHNNNNNNNKIPQGQPLITNFFHSK